MGRLCNHAVLRGHEIRWSALLLLFLLVFGCASQPPPSTVESPPGKQASPNTSEQQKSEDLTPLTSANIRGHRRLYNEGWFIVTSTREALAYAHRHSVVTSGEALNAARKDLAGHTSGVKSGVKKDLEAGLKTGLAVHRVGSRFGDAIRKLGQSAGEKQVDYGLNKLSRSWSYVKGGIYYGSRTGAHWKSLKETWPQYYGNLKSDFSNILELNQRIAQALTTEIEADWEGAFSEAADAFQSEYEASGQRGNAITALGDILMGYLKMAYEGIARPSGRSMVIAVSEGAKAGSYIFTPTMGAVRLVGRTLQSTGLSLYYGTRTGIEILSPTVEAGFLAGLGVLSLGSGAATHLGGETLGAVSQVAFSGAGVVAGAAHGGAGAAVETGKYVALVSYDVGKAATKVVFNQARSGVVLGYNALTAIPAHLLIGIPSAAIFLAYEGPKLVLVRVRENDDENRPDDQATGLADLPVGTVVDLEALKKEEGVTVEVITDDPAITVPVLENVREDLTPGEGQ